MQAKIFRGVLSLHIGAGKSLSSLRAKARRHWHPREINEVPWTHLDYASSIPHPLNPWKAL